MNGKINGLYNVCIISRVTGFGMKGHCKRAEIIITVLPFFIK